MVALMKLAGDVKNFAVFSHEHLGRIPRPLRREAIAILLDSPYYVGMSLAERAALVAWNAAKLARITSQGG